jgi:hypothetical protein
MRLEATNSESLEPDKPSSVDWQQLVVSCGITTIAAWIFGFLLFEGPIRFAQSSHLQMEYVVADSEHHRCAYSLAEELAKYPERHWDHTGNDPLNFPLHPHGCYSLSPGDFDRTVHPLAVRMV